MPSLTEFLIITAAHFSLSHTRDRNCSALLPLPLAGEDNCSFLPLPLAGEGWGEGKRVLTCHH